MASISAIRTATGTTIGDAVTDLSVYRTVPDVVNLPALVVMPADSDFVGAMGRGMVTHLFDLYVLVSNREAGLAQDELDEFVNVFGSKSVPQAVWNNRSLGLPKTDAHVSGMSEYGGSFETAHIEHIGAVLRLNVHTDGTQ